jgi:starvation-inducible outer membrane lipoprotein
MRLRRVAVALAFAAVAWSGGGCIPQYIVPEPLDRQIDRKVSFSQLQQDAERHKGSSVVLGGAVLSARILPEGTQIEVLQLTLDAYDRPTGALESSEGRFLLIDPGRRDPAVLHNSRITVVGEVVGTKVQTVDEFEYAFPYLSARFIHVWRSAPDYSYDAPYQYYYPYSYPYSYPYPYSYYPYLSLDPYPFWYGPSWYYSPPIVSTPVPERRRFDPPAGNYPSLSPPRPPAPSPGGGLRRRF